MTPTTAPTPTIAPTPLERAALPPQMIALDIDGTLVPEAATDVPDKTKEAVADVVRYGHEVVLASGRSLTGILTIAEACGLARGWAVASNGAVIARLTSTPPGFELAVPDVQTLSAYPAIVAALNARLDGLQIAVEKVGRGYRVDQLFPDGRLNGSQTVLPIPQLEAMASPRIALHAPGVRAALAEPLRRAGLTVNAAAEDWIDVTPGGVSKATALETVRRRLGIAPADTVAVGDGPNDLEMLAWAARGVAMGHAPDAVIEAADEVTGTLQEHGIGQVLRSLLPQSVPAGR